MALMCDIIIPVAIAFCSSVLGAFLGIFLCEIYLRVRGFWRSRKDE